VGDDIVHDFVDVGVDDVVEVVVVVVVVVVFVVFVVVVVVSSGIEPV